MVIGVLVETILVFVLLFPNRSVYLSWLHRRVIVQILHQTLLHEYRCTEPCSAYDPLAASFHREGPWSSIILGLSSHLYSYGFLINGQSVGHWIRCSIARNDLRSSIQFTVHRANDRITHQSLLILCFWCCLCITLRTQTFTSFVWC